MTALVLVPAVVGLLVAAFLGCRFEDPDELEQLRRPGGGWRN